MHQFFDHPYRLSELPADLLAGEMDLQAVRNSFGNQEMTPRKIIKMSNELLARHKRQNSLFDDSRILGLNRSMDRQKLRYLVHGLKVAYIRYMSNLKGLFSIYSKLGEPILHFRVMKIHEKIDHFVDNWNFREKIRRCILGRSGIVRGRERVYAYAKRYPSLPPGRSLDDLSLAEPSDFVNQYLGHRPRTENQVLTEQQSQWIEDGVHERLTKLYLQLDDLHRQLTKHKAGLQAVHDDFFHLYANNSDVDYAILLAKELRGQIELTDRYLNKTFNSGKKVAHLVNKPWPPWELKFA